MDWIVAIDILSRYFFSRIILKTKLYKHHFWSIIISTLGFIFMSSIDLITIINNKKYDFSIKMWYLLFIFPRALIFPLEDAINKILLSNDFLLPHSLMFDRGIIEFFILLIFSLILFITKKLEISYDSENIKYVILIKIAQTIVSSIKAFCLMQAIYIYSSQYVSFLVVSESFGGTLNLFINIFSNDDDYPKIYKNIIFIIAEIISVIILIFGTLMYNEMIIINKFGLQENTNRGLHIKEKNDYIFANDQEFLNDEESECNENNNGENNDSGFGDEKSIKSMKKFNKNKDVENGNKNINETNKYDKNQILLEMEENCK